MIDMTHDQKVDMIIDALEDVEWSLVSRHTLSALLHLCEYPTLEERMTKSRKFVTTHCGKTFNWKVKFHDITIWKSAQKNKEICGVCLRKILSNPERYSQ